MTNVNQPDYEAILRSEFSAEPGSFLLRLRSELTWDAVAFSRLASCMEVCAAAYGGASSLPRWLAEGFWYCSHFIQEWSSHASFPREHAPDYYTAAYERLRNLAYWFFVGDSPSTSPLPPL